MNLYWVPTEDHSEDWFMIAPNARSAARYHEVEEGYDPGYAHAERILHLPTCGPDDIGWPSHEILREYGADIVSEDSPRVVVINGRTFCEGMLESEILKIHDDILEACGHERYNQTSYQSSKVS